MANESEVIIDGAFKIHPDYSVTVTIAGVEYEYDSGTGLAEELINLVDEMHNPPPMGEGYVDGI